MNLRFIFDIRNDLKGELKTNDCFIMNSKSVTDDVPKQNISTWVAEITNEFLTIYNFKQPVTIWILIVNTQIN